VLNKSTNRRLIDKW